MDDVEADYSFTVQVLEPIVEEVIPPTFLSPLVDQIVTAGEGASWSLPDIDPGSEE